MGAAQLSGSRLGGRPASLGGRAKLEVGRNFRVQGKVVVVQLEMEAQKSSWRKVGRRDKSWGRWLGAWLKNPIGQVVGVGLDG